MIRLPGRSPNAMGPSPGESRQILDRPLNLPAFQVAGFAAILTMPRAPKADILTTVSFPLLFD